jgi:methyl-accepting chemotaxis protein
MKLTVKARLITAFVVLIGLSGAIYYMGLNNIGLLNDRINTLVDLNVKRIMLASKAAEDIQLITKREKELIITQSPEEIQEYIGVIEDRTTEMLGRMDELKGMSDETGIEIMEEFTTKWNEYAKIYGRIKSLAMRNTDSTSAEAYKLSSGDGRAAALGAISALAKISRKNENALALAKTETDKLYNEAKTQMAFLLITAILISIGISIWIITAITKSIGYAKAAIKSVAEGDLTVNIENKSHDELGELIDYIKAMVEKLREVLTFVSTASDHIATASAQMSATSQQMSQGSQEQAASAEQISSSMEEMVANIQQNTDNAQQTEKIALKAADDIQDGSRSVNHTVESMKKIAEKISIIGEIARQTNLLALNAAVEAARAGEHGKGFAVVAAEVRKLAERSQVAAAEINELSSASVAIADRSGKVLDQIVPNIQSTAKLVQEISAASLEQNTGAEQVNNAIQQFNQVIQQNASASEEMASGSEELSSQADHLRETVSFFRLDKNAHRAAVTTAYKPRPAQSSAGVTNLYKSTVKSAPSKMSGINLDMGNHENDQLDKRYENF